MAMMLTLEIGVMSVGTKAVVQERDQAATSHARPTVID